MKGFQYFFHVSPNFCWFNGKIQKITEKGYPVFHGPPIKDPNPAIHPDAGNLLHLPEIRESIHPLPSVVYTGNATMIG